MSNTENATNRRSFLKAGGLSLASMALAGSYASCTTGPEKDQTLPLKDQVALITGGARGIGRSVALCLAQKGAKVAICDIARQIESIPYPLATEKELNNTKAAIEETGADCMAFQADIRNRSKMEEIVGQIQSEWKRLDILVANAGIAGMSTFEETMDNSWDDVIGVNLTGTANSIHATLPIMKEQQYGRIICVSSQLGRQGSQQSSSYVASKWGIIGLSKSIALEAGQHNITCNTVCPTSTDTGMLNNDFVLSKVSPDKPTIEGFDKKLKSYPIPTGVLEPEKVAATIEFLCYPQSGHLSGTVMDVASNEAARNLS